MDVPPPPRITIHCPLTLLYSCPMTSAEWGERHRPRGSVRVRGRSLQVGVYAGNDPVTGRLRYLTGTADMAGIRDGSPFRRGPLDRLADLEDATSAWVAWYDTRRLTHRLGCVPPAEAEADHYATTNPTNPTGHTN